MNDPVPPLEPSSFAERIAWMHEPVHLSGARLPWFLRWYVEAVLHRMFCTLEKGLLLLMELQRQGKLELLPVAPDAEAAPRVSKYKMKFPPVAPARKADAAAVLVAAEASPEAGAADADGADGDAAVPGCAMAIGLVGRIARRPLVGPQPVASRLRPIASLRWRQGGDGRWRDRCLKSTGCTPGWALWENCA